MSKDSEDAVKAILEDVIEAVVSPTTIDVVLLDFDNTAFVFPVADKVRALQESKRVEWALSSTDVPPVITGSAREVLTAVFGGEHWNQAGDILKADAALQPASLRPLPGAEEVLLPVLANPDIYVVFISNKVTDEINKTLHSHPVWRNAIAEKGGKFTVIGGDHPGLEHKKPALDPFLQAMAALGINPAIQPLHVVCIGDGGLESDLGLAHNIKAFLAPFSESRCDAVLLNFYCGLDSDTMLPIRGEGEAASMGADIVAADYNQVKPAMPNEHVARYRRSAQATREASIDLRK